MKCPIEPSHEMRVLGMPVTDMDVDDDPSPRRHGGTIGRVVCRLVWLSLAAFVVSWWTALMFSLGALSNVVGS